jgi:hypothetical protein
MGLPLALLPTAGAEAKPNTHDGFFIQMDIGAGSLGSEASTMFGDLELSGSAGEFSVTVGAAITQNFILAGQVWAVAVEDPSVEGNGHDFADADATLILSGVGLNVTYYLPSNFYFSATPSITSLEIDTDNHRREMDTGYGIRLAVGKEWWVSDEWGLGLNLQGAWSTNEDQEDTRDSYWIGIAFTATYN